MKYTMTKTLCALGLLSLAAAAQARAEAEPKVLIDATSAAAVGAHVKSNERFGDTTFSATENGIDVGIKANGESGFPGLAFSPGEGQSWDLSQHGHISVRVTNTGEKRIYLTLRVDNAGNHQDKPWNAESKVIAPGKTETIKVIFGYAYGFKPGFKLDASKVTGSLLFSGKTDAAQSFRVESLVAGGEAGEQPPVNPEHVRITPPNGVILGEGDNASEQVKMTSNGGKFAVVEGGIQLDFAAGAKQTVAIRPTIGRWNLRDHMQVQVRLKNAGQAPATPAIRLESNDGPTETIAADAPIAPGESATITIPFAGSTPWRGPQDLETKPLKGTHGSRFASNVVQSVMIDSGAGDAARTLLVESITANMPPAQPLPDWVGKRPPIEGDWKMTFEETFDEGKIDESKWNIYTSNFWDKRSHFSKQNVLVADGKATLRFEKRTGNHNDDPAGKVTDYATGFLDTYGKWTQKYGYFEARMKLPSAPGMWPAFWLMPDRGVEAGPQWKRADTGNRGMEFDIMEYLSRWGPNRHTIAFHWDGYGDKHKATGTPVYVAPDKDGYITSGLLWLPGLAVVYCNGQEFARWENPRICEIQSYIIFTAVSGGWDNDPIDDAQLPADFVIDYVRAWQRADLANP